MLKFAFLIATLAFSTMSSADCDIREPLRNKSCSNNYFTAKNSKQLYEYLQYGKFEDGKLLNLEIGFDVKDKEINIGTSCDVRLKFDADLRASQNGICLQAKNILIRRQSSLFADKKAPVNLIANESIEIKNTKIQTAGHVNISTKLFDPFSNEILISRDSQITAEKLNINTPSSLIINDDSRIKSSNVVLNGGNCEVGDKDDRDSNDNRDRERQCKRFKPKFTYSGSCLNNPIPIAFKISSVADKADSLKLTYSVSGIPSGVSVKWKFDDEIEFSKTSPVQSFLFPGKHLAEVVVSNSNGYFRKLGAYNNVSPTKFNKGQVAIFQFSGLRNGPSKVMAMVGVKKFTLVRSERDAQLYSGEIPSDTAGNKLIAIPDFGYKGSFNLVVLPAINNPDAYIIQSVDQLSTLLDSISSTNQSYLNSKASLQSLLDEFKTKIASLQASDKQKIAEYLQANIFADLQGVTSFKQIKERPTTLFGLLVASAYADETSDFINSITHDMYSFVLSSPKLIGAGFVAVGLIGVNKLPGYWKIAGVGAIAAGAILLMSKAQGAQSLLDNIHNIDPNSIYLKLPNQINSGEVATFSIWGKAVPLDSMAPNTILISQAINAKNSLNNELGEINSQVASINSTLSLLGFSSYVEPFPLLSFPQTRFSTILSPIDVINVQLISSDDGKALIQSYSKDGNNLLITFKSSKTQHAKLRVTFANSDFGINKNIDSDIIITVVPKAIIEYTVNNLEVSFDSTDPQNPDISDLTYSWDFGDGQTFSSQSKAFTHTYSQPGTYNVSLTVNDQFGASDETTAIVEIQNDLKAVINYTKYNFTVGFDSTDPENPNLTGLNYRWDFGDGQILSTKSKYITHKYTQSGTYNVTLVVSDSNGSSAETEVIVQVQNTCRMVDVDICLGNPYLNDVTFAIPGVETFTIGKGGGCHKVSLQLRNYYNMQISSSSDLFKTIIYPLGAGYNRYWFVLMQNGDGTYVMIQDVRGKMYEGCE